MAGLKAKSPTEVYKQFREHLGRLLNQTLVHAPLSLAFQGATGAVVGFRKGERPVCVPVGSKGYHLYIGQTLAVVNDGGKVRLRTLAYAYRITEGPSFDDTCIFRWEYESAETKSSLYPRHHLHIPTTIKCFGDKHLDALKLHIPSGWITVEEVIRFLIYELKVKPKSEKWDDLLRASEQKFREWTARSN